MSFDSTCTFLLQLQDLEGCDDLDADRGGEEPGRGQVERDDGTTLKR